MPLTQRNIEIDSDAWSKLKADAIGRNKNVREFAGEILADYVYEKTRRDAGKGMKAIILAAGMSSRLMDLTEDKPKCMLEMGGKTILQRQIETFHQCGIEDITVHQFPGGLPLITGKPGHQGRHHNTVRELELSRNGV